MGLLGVITEPILNIVIEKKICTSRYQYVKLGFLSAHRQENANVLINI